MKTEHPRPRLTRETVRLYAREAWRHPVQLLLGYTAFGGRAVCGDILVPYLLGQIVDGLVRHPANPAHVHALLWWMIGVSVLDFCLARVAFLFRNPLIARAERNLHVLAFDTYQKQEYSFFTNNFVGSLVVRAQRFVSAFMELYDTIFFVTISLAVQFIVPVVVLAFTAPILSVVFVAAAVLTTLTVLVTSRYKTPVLRAAAARSSEVTGALADVLTNGLAVKVFGHSEREHDRFVGVAERRRRALYAQSMMTEKIRIARHFIGSGFQVVGAAVLVYLALRGQISVGMILTVQLYLMKLVMSLWDINRISEKLEDSLANAAEMTEIILRDYQVRDPENPEVLQVSRGAIDFHDIAFRYADASGEEQLFSSLSLKIEPGQKVGLVGPSGGGKTTLTKLLLRFMDIDGGSISIDGQDIATVQQDELRRAIAYVPQEPLLFHRSIRENIAYGDPSASDADVERAAKLAHAHGFIRKLPEGYDTLVGERGVKLSGGEKQRVAIARAMLKQAPVVVLDEATSALDSKSEKAIVSALDNLMKNRTTIVIAHRLSTIRKLDRIVVLKDGAVAEDGSHATLLKKKGTYAELWQHQSGEFLPEE